MLDRNSNMFGKDCRPVMPELPLRDGALAGHCPSCDRIMFALEKAVHGVTWDTADASFSVSGRSEWRIVECAGCGKVYFQERTRCSEDLDYEDDGSGGHDPFEPWRYEHYPAPERGSAVPQTIARVAGVDDDLAVVLEETYEAARRGSHVLAAIGLRTAFDKATALLGVSEHLTFAQKLVALQEDGRIGETERMTLGVLADAGGAAAHRGWRPSDDELAIIRSCLELFLQRTLIADVAAKRLHASIPPRARRPKA